MCKLFGIFCRKWLGWIGLMILISPFIFDNLGGGIFAIGVISLIIHALSGPSWAVD